MSRGPPKGSQWKWRAATHLQAAAFDAAMSLLDLCLFLFSQRLQDVIRKFPHFKILSLISYIN